MERNVNLEDHGNAIDLTIGENRLSLHQGDVTSLKADAIVCPVNSALDTKTGVANVIMRVAGRSPNHHRPAFPEPFGRVVVLPAGRLDAKFIFLTVLLGEKGLDKIRLSIAQSVDRTIRYAEFLRLESIAFPMLGSSEAAPPYSFIAKEMIEHVATYFRRRNTKIKVVLFSVFNADAFQVFRREVHQIANL